MNWSQIVTSSACSFFYSGFWILTTDSRIVFETLDHLLAVKEQPKR